MAFEFGRGIDLEPHRREPGELALEHVAGVHLDRLTGRDVHGVAHDDRHTRGPPGDPEAREVWDGVHVGEAIGLVHPRGREDEAGRVPRVNDICDRIASRA